MTQELFLSFSKERNGFVLSKDNVELAFLTSEDPISSLLGYLDDMSKLIVTTGLDFNAKMEDLYLTLIGSSISIRHQTMKNREADFPLDVEALAMMESSAPLENLMMAVLAIGKNHKVGELGIDLF